MSNNLDISQVRENVEIVKIEYTQKIERTKILGI